MVLTRSQSLKNKAKKSPDPAPKGTKLRKHASDGAQQAATAEDAGSRPLPKQKSNARAMGQKLTKLQPVEAPELTSHPLNSLAASPAVTPGPDFSIAAVQQQQQKELGQALQALAVGAAPAEAEPGKQQAAAGDSPMSIDDAKPPQQQQQQQADAPPEAAPAVPKQQQQQQQPLPQPRPEKLLKPLPDKPIPCDKLPDGPEPVQVEVEYVAWEDLQPVEDAAATLAEAVPGLNASEWLEVVKALNQLRQLVAHHPDTCSSQLDVLVPLVLKSVRSLRSSVCKTAIMAVADLYLSFQDALLPHTDVGGQLKPMTSLLAQILLKCSSNDKKFVIEEAQRALQVMVENLTPAESLKLLLPYADVHKNMKVRGKAGIAVADAVARMQPLDVLAFGLPQLLKVSGKLVTDNTPDARDSAKKLIVLVKAAFSDPEVEQRLGVEVPPPAQAEGEEAKQPSKWEVYCQANLSGSAALAVLKASSE